MPIDAIPLVYSADQAVDQARRVRRVGRWLSRKPIKLIEMR